MTLYDEYHNGDDVHVEVGWPKLTTEKIHLMATVEQPDLEIEVEMRRRRSGHLNSMIPLQCLQPWRRTWESKIQGRSEGYGLVGARFLRSTCIIQDVIEHWKKRKREKESSCEP